MGMSAPRSCGTGLAGGGAEGCAVRGAGSVAHLHRGRLKAAFEVAVLAALDLALVVLCFEAAVLARLELLPRLPMVRFPEAGPTGEILTIWWVPALWAFFAAYEGLYTRRFSYWDEIKTLWKIAFFATVGVFTLASVGKMGDEISRTVVILLGAAAFFLWPPLRMVAKRALRAAGLLKRRVLVLGAGKTGLLISRALRKEPNYGYEVVGFLDDDPAKVGCVLDGVKVHRGVDLAERYIARCGVTDLVLAMPGVPRERVQGILNAIQQKVERILFVPDVFGMSVVGTTLQHFFQEQAIALELKNNLAQPLNRATKRLFDYVVGAALLAALALPLMLIAAIVSLTSPGPVLYRQRRVGRHGVLFDCLKFRTMYADAEKRLGEILSTDPSALDEWNARWKLADDPRVTRIGRFLRLTSLDELPQIFNVLRGEMSLVGPRPVTQDEIDLYYRESASLVLSVLPGITGLWQVSGRSETSYDYRIALDNWYVRNWNLWLDVVILLKTLPVVYRREGAC
jgi:undecaprenyl-phosphate galactose phosphotransferase